jgi:putative Ca2+/H+ antiporter (TMEM165/GDT1 family)
MQLKLFLAVFWTVFVAELGDKTQLATFLYAADPGTSKPVVFVAAAAALVTTSALGVLAGTAVSQQVNPRLLSWIAGIGFIGVGIWTLVRA